MSQRGGDGINRDELPFVAPCQKLKPWAPFRWIRLGFADLMKAPQQSMAYGLVVAIMLATVSLALFVATGVE